MGYRAKWNTSAIWRGKLLSFLEIFEFMTYGIINYGYYINKSFTTHK